MVVRCLGTARNTGTTCKHEMIQRNLPLWKYFSHVVCAQVLFVYCPVGHVFVNMFNNKLLQSFSWLIDSKEQTGLSLAGMLFPWQLPNCLYTMYAVMPWCCWAFTKQESRFTMDKHAIVSTCNRECQTVGNTTEQKSETLCRSAVKA